MARSPVAETVSLHAADGVRLAAVHLEGPDSSRPIAVVVGHGFTQSTARPGTRAVLEALAAHAGVIGVDFRGHGASGGHSTVGHQEVLDMDAAVTHARELGYAAVVTCGWSMGGSVVLRHAALHGGVDAVVSVSAVSRWFYKGTKPMRRVHWVIETRLGRLIAHRAFRTRITGDGWPEDTPPESPVDVIGRIAPVPVLIVHGDRDHYFPVEHPNALYAAAREPKELWLVEGFAHAESGASPELLDRIGRHLPDLVARGGATGTL
ncbi:MAG TPA: alpha/beta hydrolase [Mycobacteriales bacterium]|nr:alpha/beta hydrolase [Mycobacteriales bacterium]HWC34222.1 alpha/beta hydrolase [Mycobacteriales bacterium]